MLLIDHRKDYRLLINHFKPYGIQVVKAGGEDSTYPELQSGDIVFTGDGPEGTCTVGIERKALSDLLSSLQSGRLAGSQMINLMEYDYYYLVVEGQWRAGEHGELEVRRSVKGKWGWHGVDARGRRGGGLVMYRELSNRLHTLALKCGVQVVRTMDHRETVAWAAGVYRWFEKKWDSHRSHEELYAPVVAPVRGKVMLRRPGAVEMWASQLPGVDRRAWEVGKVFKTPHELANASVEELMRVEGLGKVGAEKIWKWVRGKS